MTTQKTAKTKVTITVSDRVLAATGHRGETRKIGQEIDGAFAERDQLRGEVEKLRADLRAVQAAVAVRDAWIANVCDTMNALPQNEYVFWQLGELRPPTALDAPRDEKTML